MALSRLGAPIRTVELTQEQMCDLLSLSIGDYAERIQNFVIQSQWSTLYGKNFQNAADMVYALTVRTLDMSVDLSYFFSKEVGLQQRGPWELKKDFFKVERGKQVYVLPPNREINEVMYVTPSTTKAALYGSMGTLDTGIGGGYSQLGSMGNGVGLGGFFIGSAYDTTLLAADLKYKNQMIRSDLAYKVTAGPDGTRLVHLMSTPGSFNSAGGISLDDNWGWNRYANSYVWYTYYDATKEDSGDCKKKNTSVLISPDQVPMDQMQFEYMNEPSKVTVRQLFIAQCFITLALIRGKFSGKVSIPNSEVTLNTSDLMDIGKTERDKALENLDKRLEAMLPWNVAENNAKLVENTVNALKYTPLGTFIA
jgi:hypothetical protein